MAANKIKTGEPGRAYIQESADFRAFVDNKRTEAQRDVDDLTTEINALADAIRRRNEDTNLANERDNAEISARRAHLDDKLEVVAMCASILDVPAPAERKAPVIAKRTGGD